MRAGQDRVLSIVRDVTDWNRANERSRDLAGRLIASQEAERHRIARELHDDLSQKLAVLTISTDRLSTSLASGHEQFRELRAQIVEIATDIRNLSHELHPSKLQTLGLVESLKSLCHDIAEQRGVHIVFVHENVPSAFDLEIADSGIGFESEKAERAGLGLVSMRERMALLNGQLKLHAFPGGGTRIGIRVRLHPVFDTAYAASNPSISDRTKRSRLANP